MALKTNGTLWTWGSNTYYELGNGGSPIEQRTPAQVGSDTTWSQISTKRIHVLAIKNDGSLWGWGDNFFHQLGDGTNTDRPTPTRIGTDNNWTQIAAGPNYSLAVKTNGTMWSWGSNNLGNLGDGSTTTRTSPVQIDANNNWKLVAAGGGHGLALKNNGAGWSWGYNFFGTLGNNDTTRTNAPIIIHGAILSSSKNVTINALPSNAVTTTGNSLSANEAGASYQWLDCNNNNSPISGATAQSFSPSTNGSYAVIVSKNGCTDTSVCTAFTITSVMTHQLGQKLNLYPNPTSGEFTIQFDQIESPEIMVVLRNSIGQELLRQTHTSLGNLTLAIEGASGMYFVEVSTGDKHSVLKVLKQ